MITHEDILKASKGLKTMNIKGKEYVEVNTRVKAFRMLLPSGSIKTELIKDEAGVCTFKAEIYDGNLLLATGYAQEKESSSFINKTSYIENCETSAVGRALGFLGIGIDGGIASADEVTTAINNQSKGEQSAPKQKPEAKPEATGIGDLAALALESLLKENDIDKDFILHTFKVESLSGLTNNQHVNVVNHIDNVKEQYERWKQKADS